MFRELCSSPGSAETEIEARDALAVVHADGAISWYPHCIFRSSCAINVNNFPFDEQICNMWFGSWTYISQEVDLKVFRLFVFIVKTELRILVWYASGILTSKVLLPQKS